jgi:hypothetical protein
MLYLITIQFNDYGNNFASLVKVDTDYYAGSIKMCLPTVLKPTSNKCHWGSKLLAGVQLEPHHRSKSKRNTHLPHSTRSACQVIDWDIGDRIIHQFIEANRAPWEASKGK